MSFPSHDENSAPEASKPLLEGSLKAFGRIPGLHKVLAESPQAFEGYQMLHKLFQATDFDADRTAPSQRSPDQVRSMLSRYKTGLERGRGTRTDGES